jgi:hypothetical protein
MPLEAWLAEVDARPDYDYSTESHGWVLVLIACGPEIVCSPVVLQDPDSLGTLWRPGEDGSPHEPNFAQGVWFGQQFAMP